MERIVFLSALALILMSGITRAESSYRLPSRQAHVVIPILSHFSPDDTSRENVLNKLKSVLGPFDRNDKAGPDGFLWRIYSYRLDDGTEIIVYFKENWGPHSMDLAAITEHCTDGKLKRLYDPTGRGSRSTESVGYSPHFPASNPSLP